MRCQRDVLESLSTRCWRALQLGRCWQALWLNRCWRVFRLNRCWRGLWLSDWIVLRCRLLVVFAIVLHWSHAQVWRRRSGSCLCNVLLFGDCGFRWILGSSRNDLWNDLHRCFLGHDWSRIRLSNRSASWGERPETRKARKHVRGDTEASGSALKENHDAV